MRANILFDASSQAPAGPARISDAGVRTCRAGMLRNRHVLTHGLLAVAPVTRMRAVAGDSPNANTPRYRRARAITRIMRVP